MALRLLLAAEILEDQLSLQFAVGQAGHARCRILLDRSSSESAPFSSASMRLHLSCETIQVATVAIVDTILKVI